MPTTIRRLLAAAAVLALGLAPAALSGCGSGEDPTADAANDPAAARAAYQEYLLESAEAVNSLNAELQEKAEAGRFDEARSRFAAAQVQLGHLKPFFTLSNVSEALFTPPEGAYPRIERALWKEEDGAGAATAAGEATELIDRLEQQLRAVTLEPATIAGNGRRTIDEILTLDLGLEVNPYSHLEVVNASANLEGLKAAFEAISPELSKEDAQLPRRIEGEIEAAFAALEKFGVPAYEPKQPGSDPPGTSFISSTLLEPQDLQPVHAPVKKLAALFNRSLNSLLEPPAGATAE